MTTAVRLRAGYGSAAEVTESIGQTRGELARRYGLPRVLLEQHQLPNRARRCPHQDLGDLAEPVFAGVVWPTSLTASSKAWTRGIPHAQQQWFHGLPGIVSMLDSGRYGA